MKIASLCLSITAALFITYCVLELSVVAMSDPGASAAQLALQQAQLTQLSDRIIFAIVALVAGMLSFWRSQKK